jgi:hypothetical protein
VAVSGSQGNLDGVLDNIGLTLPGSQSVMGWLLDKKG